MIPSGRREFKGARFAERRIAQAKTLAARESRGGNGAGFDDLAGFRQPAWGNLPRHLAQT